MDDRLRGIVAEAHVPERHVAADVLRRGGQRGVGRLFRLVEEGLVRPVIDSVMPLKDAPLAHERMEKSDHFGKIILAP